MARVYCMEEGGATGMLFGVDWYPEQWDEGRWEEDARRMAAFGLKAARIMEFAWALVEPEPGRFDFSLFERAMDVLARQGISTVLGTPTASLPAWLALGGEPTRQVHRSGRERDFGARREACFSSPAYREASHRLVEEIARRFGRDERVIGFQVDNEPGHEGSDICVCPLCRAAWPRWLQARYGTVEALNGAWGAVFWGRTLRSFNQAPLPRDQPALRPNPALVIDYWRFQSEAAADFMREQTEILHAGAPGKWVTTNLYAPPLSSALDLERLCEGMDFASLDNYPVWGDMDEPWPWFFSALMAEWTRGIRRGKPFAVMEQFTGIQGHASLGHYPPEARVLLWTLQMAARGADKIFFFRWRTAAFGQEQLCRGLLDPDDAETPWATALRRGISALKPELEGLDPLPPPAPCALVLDKDSFRLIREQYLSEALRRDLPQGQQAGAEYEVGRHYAPFALYGMGTEVISSASLAEGGPEPYRLISLPLYQMADPALAERLGAWVQAGGTLVLSWRTGTRDGRNQAPAEAPPGPFRRLAGLSVRRWEGLNRGKTRLRIRGLPALLPAHGEVWADIPDLEGARAEAWYAGRDKHWRGAPAVTVNALGKGRVWYLATSLDPLALILIWKRIFRSSGLQPRWLGADIERVERRDADGRPLTILLNHSPRARRALGRRIPPWGWAFIRG